MGCLRKLVGEGAVKITNNLIRSACVACALLWPPGKVAAEPQNGWWWNPAESGRGFFIETTRGVTYLAGYFYDEDGRATWVSSGGSNSDPYLYRGTLQSYRNGQTLFGAYRAPGAAVDVGPVEVRFVDDSHGTFTWPGGTIPIERQVFGVEDEIPLPLWVLGLADPPFRPETGWWWNQAQSGRGFSIEVQGTNLFAVSFMYDDAGDPTWYFSAGPMATPTHYEGDVLLFENGQTLNGPYRFPGHQTIGRMTIDFAGTGEATIAIADGISEKMSASSLKRNTGSIPTALQIPRLIFSPEDLWPQWVGYATQKFYDEVTDAGTTGKFTKREKQQYDLQWVRKRDTAPPGILGWYVLASTSRVIYEFSTEDTSNGCKESALESYGGLEGILLIREDLTYGFDVAIPNAVTATVYGHCDDGNGNTSTDQRDADIMLMLNVGVSRSRHIWDMNSYPNRLYSAPLPKLQDVHAGEDAIITWDLVAGGSGP
jgi:hypothetical protein